MRIEENDTQLAVYFSGQVGVMRYVLGALFGFYLFAFDIFDVNNGGGINWLPTLIFMSLILGLIAIWRVKHCSINGRFIFDRKERVLHAIRPAFWGRQESVSFLPLSYFDGIQSYILQTPHISLDKHNPDWEMNVLELVTPEPIRGVVFHRFLPIINKRGAFKKERLENPDAALLAQRLSDFMGFANYGFVGEKQRTTPLIVHAPEKSQFERMFF